MGHHHYRGAYRVPVIPAVGVVEQAPSAYQGASGRQHLPQHLRAAFIDLERPAFVGAGHGHRARLIPAEQLICTVVRVGGEPVQRHRHMRDNLAHQAPPAGDLHDDERQR
jgi:hypothetical protein